METIALNTRLRPGREADYDRLHNVMARGSFLVSRGAARVLVEQGSGGDIVYIASKNAVFAGPNNVAYGSVKAAQAHQVRLLAAELGPHRIRVNGVHPDAVVRGSGIFAGEWAQERADAYGVPAGAHRRSRRHARRRRPQRHDRHVHSRRRGHPRRFPPLSLEV